MCFNCLESFNQYAIQEVLITCFSNQFLDGDRNSMPVTAYPSSSWSNLHTVSSDNKNQLTELTVDATSTRVSDSRY